MAKRSYFRRCGSVRTIYQNAQNNFKINHNKEDMIKNVKKYDLPLDNSNYVVNKSYDMKKIIKDKKE